MDVTSSEEESEGNNENDLGSDNEHVSKTSFVQENDAEFQKNPNPSGKTVNSEDPFGIYKILKRNKYGNNPGNTSQPNPTKSGNNEKAPSDKDICNHGMKFQTSGSILEVMDELIKAGQTIGYNMDRCMKNIETIIGSQGDDNSSSQILDISSPPNLYSTTSSRVSFQFKSFLTYVTTFFSAFIHASNHCLRLRSFSLTAGCRAVIGYKIYIWYDLILGVGVVAVVKVEEEEEEIW
nr:hypothetical protein [Tanacetum cinerariifolium]